VPDAGTPDGGNFCHTFRCDCNVDGDCVNGMSCQFGICFPNMDASVPDVGTPDVGTPDAGFADAAAQDAAAPDATTPDANTPDAATPDAATAPDSGTPAACTPGTTDCECRTDGTCIGSALDCRRVLINYTTYEVASRCVPNSCPDGTAGCPCFADATCNSGLNCTAYVRYANYPPIYYCTAPPSGPSVGSPS
jgi:hypothetical protein